MTTAIDRADAEALMPEDAVRDIFQEVEQQSVVGQLARRLRNGTRSEMRLPVLDALPFAYFVDGDTGYKRVTKVAWDNVFIRYGEIACIVPVPENVFDDADYPIWDEAQPHIVGAVNEVFDRAVFYKEGAPSNWPAGLVQQIADAGQAVPIGSVGTDLYDDLLGEGGVLGLVEEDGFMATGHAAHPAMKAKMRGLRSDQRPLFAALPGEAGKNRYALDGEPVSFATNGSIDRDNTLLISGDWNQLVWSVRQDVTWKLLDQAVIQDPGTGDIVFNLPQQDMVALRMKFRVGWALPNPPNRLNADAETRFPFASLVPSGSQYS